MAADEVSSMIRELSGLKLESRLMQSILVLEVSLSYLHRIFNNYRRFPSKPCLQSAIAYYDVHTV